METEAATKCAVIPRPGRQFAPPNVAPSLPQPLFFRPKGGLPRILRWQPHPFDLHADEGGAVRIAVFLQPVSEDQPGGVVVRGINDRLQEGAGFVGFHGQAVERWSREDRQKIL